MTSFSLRTHSLTATPLTKASIDKGNGGCSGCGGGGGGGGDSGGVTSLILRSRRG